MSNLNSLIAADSASMPLSVTVPQARPIRIDPEGASAAFLLLHGFSGHPGECMPLAEALAAEGYAVSAPRYPGHGTCRADFLRTKACDWVRRAYDEYLDLRSRYGTVYVAGHSMGGLIASAIAISFDAPRLILLAPAFEFANGQVALSPLVAPFKKVIARNLPPGDFDRADSARMALHGEYWSDILVPVSAELYRLNRKCRKNIGRLKSRTLVLVGEQDQIVPARVVDYLRRSAPHAASFDSHVIAGAGHCFPFDAHSTDAIRATIEWLKKTP
jgi:carboxylesterase